MTPTRKLAEADVFPIGLGGMPMSLEGRPPEERSIRAIHAALDAGVALPSEAGTANRFPRAQRDCAETCGATIACLNAAHLCGSASSNG